MQVVTHILVCVLLCVCRERISWIRPPLSRDPLRWGGSPPKPGHLSATKSTATSHILSLLYCQWNEGDVHENVAWKTVPKNSWKRLQGSDISSQLKEMHIDFDAGVCFALVMHSPCILDKENVQCAQHEWIKKRINICDTCCKKCDVWKKNINMWKSTDRQSSREKYHWVNVQDRMKQRDLYGKSNTAAHAKMDFQVT